MRDERIGNDISIAWGIKSGDSPFPLEGKNVTLYLHHPYGKQKVEDFRLEGNKVIWTFKGVDQKYVGKHGLTLVVNEGANGMITTDSCDFVNLVSCSCQVGGEDNDGVQTETRELTSTLGFIAYDDTEIREELSRLETDKADKSELTELLAETEVLKEAQQFTDVAVKDLQDMKIDREADDYYPKLAVGLADNLAGVDVVDSEIHFRRTGGGAISDGVARIENIKGNSVVWNQRWSLGVRQGAIDNTDGASPKYVSLGFIPWYTTAINGHKILTIANDKEGVIDRVYWNDQVQNDVRGGAIYEAKTAQTTGSSLTARCPANTIANYDVTVQLYDLTQMFGSGYEPTTIEEFYARIPMGVDLNADNEGEVIHMDVQSVESVGVNQWDEEWEEGDYHPSTGGAVTNPTRIRSKNAIRIIGSQSYYLAMPKITSAFISLFFYDAEDKYISSQDVYMTVNKPIINPPQGAEYMRLSLSAEYGTTYKHDICINISDTAVNGKYFPYIKRVEDLSIIRKYFPQGMKSVGTAHDEIRYNKASGKWEKVVRIGEVNLGIQNWIQDIDNTRYRFEASTLKMAFGINLFCAKYPSAGTTSPSLMAEKTICVSNSATLPLVRIKDSNYTDAAALKASLQGVMLYYELAEPIVTELDEADQFKDLDYQVWNAGTEKATFEGKSAPLAADITYGFNAIGKIKELESLVAQLRAKVGI